MAFSLCSPLLLAEITEKPLLHPYAKLNKITDILPVALMEVTALPPTVTLRTKELISEKALDNSKDKNTGKANASITL